MARSTSVTPPTAGGARGRRHRRRRRRPIAGAALTAVGVLLGTVVAPPGAPAVAAARVIHVAPNGTDTASGDASSPVRTVRRAVQLAAAGDVVEIASGTYHESVQVYGKEVHLRAAPGADVAFDGAVPVAGWSQSGDDWWAPWDSEFQRAGTPHVDAARPEAGWPEQFFLDGVQLREVTSRAAVVPGTFYNDIAADRVWIGDDPGGRLVEGSNLPWGIYFNHAHGSSLRDVEVRRYATPHTNMAAVRAYGHDIVIDGVTVSDNAYMGLSAIGDRVRIVDSTARRNGHLGLHAHLATDMSIDAATVVDNNREGFDAWHAAGGVKITTTTGFSMTDSYVARNGGPGIWTDLDTSRVRIARNLVEDNARSGVEVELSFDVIVVDNAVVGNGEAGVWILESRDARVWHNALFANMRDIWVEEGPRADVSGVSLFANTLGGGTAGAPGLLNVDDWTEERSAADMGVRADHNRYWLPAGSPTPHLSRWANWPGPLSSSATIDEHRAATGQDANGTLSRATTNPYLRDAVIGDHRQPIGAPPAGAIPADVAAVAGVDAGARFPAGPLSPGPGTEPPTTEPPPSTTPPTSEPPGTAPPSTTPPTSEPPGTAPPSTTPPTSEPPGTAPPSTTPPTSPPTTPPTTAPPSSAPVGSRTARVIPGPGRTGTRAVRVAVPAAAPAIAGSAPSDGAAFPGRPARADLGGDTSALAPTTGELPVPVAGWRALAALVAARS